MAVKGKTPFDRRGFYRYRQFSDCRRSRFGFQQRKGIGYFSSDNLLSVTVGMNAVKAEQASDFPVFQKSAAQIDNRAVFFYSDPLDLPRVAFLISVNGGDIPEPF